MDHPQATASATALPVAEGDAGPRVQASDEVLCLRLMATTDLHGHLLPWDYERGRPQPGVGLSRTAALIARARAEVPGAFLFDNGDTLQGSALANDALARPAPRPAHPVIAALNALGYDAATPGNHDFGFGLDRALRALADAAYPVVCANAARRLGRTPDDDRLLFQPWTILTRRLATGGGRTAALRVGVIGFLPPEVCDWESHHLAGRLHVRAIEDSAPHWLARLRAAGPDVVVALCHAGLAGGTGGRSGAQSVRALARLGGIDAIIAGHTHIVFPGPDAADDGPASDPALDAVGGRVCGVPAVSPGWRGSHLGIIDLDLRRRGGAWAVTGSRVLTRALPADDRGDDSAPGRAVASLAAPAHARLLRRGAARIGDADRPLHTYFARVAPSAAMALVHRAQLAWLDRALADGPHAGLPRLSAASPGRTGGRGGADDFCAIPAGPLRHQHLAGLCPHPDRLCALVIDGAQFADWLERAAAQFLALAPAQTDQPLLCPRTPGYAFDTFAGADYAYDLSRPAQRLAKLTVQGRPVTPGQHFAVVTTRFRLAGGGGFGQLATLRPVATSRGTADRPLAALLRADPAAVPAAATALPGWRLGAPEGTAAWFDTGPGAMAHLDEAAALGLEPVGPSPAGDGMVRFRLRF